MATQQQSKEPSADGDGTKRSPSRAREEALTRGREYLTAGPLALMRRVSEDMDRLVAGVLGAGGSRWEDWQGHLGFKSWPEIDVTHSGDKLIVQADVPGLGKDDVQVEVRDNELCISGERRSESERTEGHFYRSERSYGRFCRTIPLPEGANVDTASATFENGVLRVEIDAPQGQQTRSRRIEVKGGH